MSQWTVEKLKRELPLLIVKFNHRFRSAKVVGRKNEMASIIIPGIGTFDFAWDYIVKKLNKNERIEV